MNTAHAVGKYGPNTDDVETYIGLLAGLGAEQWSAALKTFDHVVNDPAGRIERAKALNALRNARQDPVAAAAFSANFDSMYSDRNPDDEADRAAAWAASWVPSLKLAWDAAHDATSEATMESAGAELLSSGDHLVMSRLRRMAGGSAEALVARGLIPQVAFAMLTVPMKHAGLAMDANITLDGVWWQRP